ncbi:ATP-binding protein [Corynebacterium camporealensis]
MSLAERAGTTPTVFIEDLFEGKAEVSGETDWTVDDYAEAICSTGLPGIYRLQGRLRRQYISAYIQRVIDRDVPDQGLMVRRPESMRAWWTAYAAASSTTTKYNKILDAATSGDANKLSKDSAVGYRDVLTQLWLLDPVPAWHPGRAPLKRLTTGPKHQIFDPGIAAALLGLTPEMLVSTAPGSWEVFGQLFESLVTLTVRSAGQAAEAQTSHLRTQGGDKEVDLILERYDGKVLAFEVKLSPTPTDKDVRHLHWLGEQLGDRLVEKVVVTTGSFAYRREDGCLVVPLSLLG